MNDNPTPHSHPRTEAALQRLRQAMATIEAEIAAHGGSYPYNHGRLNQSELCRRADVKKATLQNPVHKDSTRVEVMEWCDAINARLMQVKDAARLEDSAAPPPDAAAIEALQQQLEAALQRIATLEQENAGLRARLGSA
jgi:predicted trehalose synthase